MISRSWSTAATRPKERFSYWHEAVCAAVLNVATENPPERDFAGSIAAVEFGDLRFARFGATRHEIVRTRRHVDRAPSEHMLVSLQQSGRSLLSQFDRSCELRTGEVGIVDAARPFHISFPGDVRRAVAVLPRQLVLARAPWLARNEPVRIGADFAFHDLLRDYLLRLSAADSGVGEGDAALLTDNLCNLLALATARRAEADGARPWSRDLEVDVLLSFMRRNLADPTLTPGRAATHLGVSVRTVHNRFEEIGLSFGRWLLEARLEACHRTLASAGARHLAISAIAFGWGFNDLSHFNRAFKAKFGATPGRVRRGQ
jgi:AraC family transcriptional activator of tynA and feaB